MLKRQLGALFLVTCLILITVPSVLGSTSIDKCGATTASVNTTNASVDTKTAPVGNPSSNGITTYKLCSENECHKGGDGSFITITNHENATDPTYDQLITFLKKDKTDGHKYIPSQYICTEFAKELHNNAEKAGLRCAFIGCDFKEGGIGHAFNMFKTTDKGTIYIDCTGTLEGSTYEDKVLNCVVGQPLTGNYLFKEGSPGESMGTVGKLYYFQ